MIRKLRSRGRRRRVRRVEAGLGLGEVVEALGFWVAGKGVQVSRVAHCRQFYAKEMLAFC